MIHLQLLIYSQLVYEFICDLAIYNESFENFFCGSTLMKIDDTIDMMLNNRTVYYINDQLLDDIDVFFFGIGSFLKFLIGPGINYIGRSLIFVGAEILVIGTYLVILSSIIIKIILGIIIGIVYSTGSINMNNEFNITQPTFEESFNMLVTRFDNNAILDISGYDFFNKSTFPCPPGYCETLGEFIIQTEEFLKVTYDYVPFMFIWIDTSLCAIQNLHLCGEDYGLCRYMFDQSYGLINNMLKAFIQKLITGGLNFIFPNGAQSYTSYVLSLPIQICSEFLSSGECPCWVCPIDPIKQTQVYNILKLGPKGGIACNIYASIEEMCCLTGLSDVVMYDKNCNAFSGSPYTSIFYYLNLVSFVGNNKMVRPFKCNATIGYGYEHLTQELTILYEEYYESSIKDEYPDFFDIYYKMYSFEYIYDVNYPYDKSKNLVKYSLTATWFGYDESISENSDIYIYKKKIMLSLCQGCIGPNWLNYYYSEISKDITNSELTMISYNNDPFKDNDFMLELSSLVILYYEGDYSPFRFHNVIYIPPGLISNNNEPSQIYCYHYLKAKEISLTKSYYEKGNIYEFHMTFSLIKQLREQYLAMVLNEAFDNIGLDYNNDPDGGYKKWTKFKDESNRITPSVLYSFIKNENLTIFLEKIKQYSNFLTHREEIISYISMLNYIELI